MRLFHALEDDGGGKVAELQSKRMVEDFNKEGKMKNYIAVYDVSKSISGTPTEICVALGLLLSKISDDPWKGKVIRFSENSTNAYGRRRAFKVKNRVLLQLREVGKGTDDQKGSSVSDMEFDKASERPLETNNYNVIKRNFREKECGDAVPEIVFLNLRDSKLNPSSPIFLSTGNPYLDLFFQVVSITPSNSLINLLHLAWSYNPLTALKLIHNLCGVRGTGKSDKNGFYTVIFWLHQNHPKTLAYNLPTFANFGYFKDFP
ncbi:hypothetical protein RDABS01_032439 [Bienertia sinuspersici]